MIEILAPVGNIDTVSAAVRAGADAVYFGAGSFNARRNAKNFTDSDVESAAKYCRIRGVKTYLTLNTLVSDNERIDALKTAYMAAEKGVDALIVQDIGLAMLLKTNIPEIPLHASTQMSVHSAEGLYLLKEIGFERVVPAREMDKRALQKLCRTAQELGLEVEAFVHGALCMCLSGQCYLSSLLGGRSGNRGLCAQPCRLPFSVAGGTGHDLSLKDMSYIDHIGELADMGVCSFKIEGRMKRPEYVAAATAAARAVADGKPVPCDVAAALSGVFSRSGHTDGYYTDSLGKRMFGIRTETDEQLSKQVLNTTHELYRNERQSVAISGTLIVKDNEPLRLTVTDGINEVTAVGDMPEKALKVAATVESITQKVEKLGGTCYYFDELAVDLDDGLAVSGGALGELRKSAVELLSSKRGEATRRIGKFKSHGIVDTKSFLGSNKPAVVAQFRSVEQIPDNLKGIAAVILPTETDFSALKHLKVPVIADIPRGVMHNGDRVIEQLKSAAKNGVKAAVCNNVAAYYFAKEAGLRAIAGFGMNIYNSNSLAAVEGFSSAAAVLSFEASLKDAVKMSGNIPRGVISYGRLPLMIFRNCPGKNGDGCRSCGGKCYITDRKEVEFPVMCRGEFSELFNSRPVWLFDREREMSGLDFQLLYFTDESVDRVEQVINAASGGLQPDCEFTRGLYYREVL